MNIPFRASNYRNLLAGVAAPTSSATHLDTSGHLFLHEYVCYPKSKLDPETLCLFEAAFMALRERRVSRIQKSFNRREEEFLVPQGAGRVPTTNLSLE